MPLRILKMGAYTMNNIRRHLSIPNNLNYDDTSILLYAHYDCDNTIDEHVIYQLKSLHEFNIDIIFISNSKLTNESISSISNYISYIVQRNDEGYDWEAWREVIINLNIDILSKYNRLIIMNDSCYGPIFPLDEMFSKMMNLKIDFWGITKSSEPDIIKHIQPYFCVFNKSLLVTNVFYEFWKNMNKIYSYEDAVKFGELKMTEYFSNYGFKYSVYVDVEKMEYIPSIGIDRPFVYSISYWLIYNFRIPFIKNKSFMTLYGKLYNSANDVFKAIEDSGSLFPKYLILNHIRRTKPLSWHKNLPGTLNILDENLNVIPNNNFKIAVFAHFFYEDQFDEGIRWIKNIPYPFDLYITVSSEKKSKQIKSIIAQKNLLNVKKIEIRIFQDRGRDVAAWIFAFKDIHYNYDIALKFHIKKSPSNNKILIWKWNRFLMESMLASPGYISQLINLFKDSNKLGLVFHTFPPVLTLSIHSQEGNRSTSKWKKNIINRFSKNNKEETSWSVYPNNIFWYRPRALYPLLSGNIELNEFPEEPFPLDGTIAHGIERAIPYIAHGEGYHYKLVMPKSYILSSFQHFEDYILSCEGNTPYDEHKKYMKYCKRSPGSIPIYRAFQIFYLSFYSHLKKIIKKIVLHGILL